MLANQLSLVQEEQTIENAHTGLCQKLFLLAEVLPIATPRDWLNKSHSQASAHAHVTVVRTQATLVEQKICSFYFCQVRRRYCKHISRSRSISISESTIFFYSVEEVWN